MSKAIKGTKKNDRLVGDEADNKIHGKKGDDEILGLGGDDRLKGDQGNDLLDGGEGDDILEGKQGDDSLFGGAGDDLLVGDGSAKDFLSDGSGGSGKGSGGSGKGSGGSGKASGDASGKASGKGSGKGKGKGSGKASGKGSEKASGKGSDGGSGKGSGSGKASGSDKGSGSGSGKASGSGSGDGNDYLDGGAGNDRLFARGGDDTGHYNVSENSGATDTYDGGKGIDTLSLELTLEEWLDPGFQTDLAGYLAFLDNHIDANTGESDNTPFSFTAFDLTASAWENLAATVDGVETNPADEAVTAMDDNLATDEESAIQGNVLNDNGNGADDIPDYLREVTLVSSPAGSLQLNDDGSFDYDPDGQFEELAAGELGEDSFVYQVEDADGDTDTATATVIITGVNDAPEANADSAVTDEDTSVTINVLGNDTDPDANDALTVVSAVDGDNGAVAIVNNELIYSPNANFNGSDEFSYTIEDSSGETSTATVAVTVNPVADPAQLGSAEVDLTETDAQQTIGGVLSISDPDAGEESFNVQTNSAGIYGFFSIDANGNWSFTTDGALDFLAEGQEVSDSFTVSSIDGTETSVTVNITGTADGPTAVADTNALTASGPAQSTGNTVNWVDWHTITPTGSGVTDEVTIDGTITLSDRTIGVTYTGQIYPSQTFVSPSNTIQRWDSNDGTQWLANGDGVYTSAEVANGPGATNLDFIALALADTPRNLTFTEPVANLFFAVASMNNNGYLFDQPFTVVSSAEGPNDRGEWGWTAGITLSENNGQHGISTAGFSPNEFHGVLAINNAVDSLTWVSQSVEFWQGFTVGTYGVATSATVSGNVISNDDQGGSPPAEVSDVNGTAMVGNSVTLNLASGAILKVDRDGDYLYDDNNAFGALAAGQTSVDTVTYTIEDTSGNTDSATLSVTVTGINDAPVAVDDTIVTNEDLPGSISIPLMLSNDTDIDAGDTKSLVSVQDAVNGTVSISAANVQFIPDPNFNGEASFTYTMQDAGGLTSTATVHVTVNPVTDVFTPQNLITNGSFESGTTGWTRLAGGVDPVSDWQAADGNTLLDLNALERGGVEQSIATTTGATYQVSFALSKNPGETGTAIARVEAGLSSQDYAFSASNSTTNMLWSTQQFSFTATGSNEILSFTSLTPSTPQGFPGDAQGPALDEVVVVTNQIVNDFDIGLGGDKVDLSSILDSINAPDNPIAFAQGFVNFQPSGADTLIQIDADGSNGGQDYLTVMTLVGVNLTVADTDNYIL